MNETNLNPQHTIHNTKAFPSFSKPKIIGCFSVGPEREYISSAENLKFLNMPNPRPGKPLRIDLNEGFEIRKPKPDSAKQERIDHPLRFIAQNVARLRNHCVEANTTSRKSLNVDFVCFRGLLRMVMCTPYEKKTSWIILASKYKGTIYLCAKDTPEKELDEANQTEQQKRFCYYGFKFEQYILTDEPNETPNTAAAVVESEEFCAMFSATLEGKRVLYGAEMDGIVTDETIDKAHLNENILNRLEFVEVKVKRRETNQRQVNNFYRFKTRNWWCQSFLVNIGKIFVGLRNDQGIVNEIKEMSLREIDRDSRQFWSASVCMVFCSKFLAKVNELMNRVDCPHTVYRFEYDANRSQNILFNIQKGQSDESFIPDWYCAVV
ncbi:decapping nuclease DXO homolog [Toxorhynchites rutilus septentrionalis]|uniref:decapping nuclease DXO homolog n=1 Tax=Toxorhynchites rutilus septentrionalis TaxID=329112 RepID=UPI002478A27D|nr:decapping nuclease DXO homolog [Toxorhynchites rutilus septentrionalis]